ncbi:MAG: glycerophosphoryl diester phosphodiesterase [Alphaproteobacteria bacterium]|nr:MAG: glycerophosphoryl diester phosphodiesterase [Alphaproteobacteria bacterium]
MPTGPWRAAATIAAALSLGGNGMAFDLQGHRGARGLAPENTLAGFARALAIGVSTLEMDIGVTADGVVVVSHDPALNPDITRGADGRYIDPPGPAIRSLTLAELRRYDVGRIRPGSRYAGLYPDQQAVDGERIPTLAEVVALTRRLGADTVRFNIETKLFPDRPDRTVPAEEMAERLAAVLETEGLAERAIVQSFDWRTLTWFQANRPGIALAWLTSAHGGADTVSPRGGRPSIWLAGHDPAAFGGSIPRTVQAAGGRIWSPDHRGLAEAEIAEAKALGLVVIPWTVNDPAVMDRLIGWGVDGLISDYPDRLRAVLARRGMDLPPQAGSAR